MKKFLTATMLSLALLSAPCLAEETSNGAIINGEVEFNGYITETSVQDFISKYANENFQTLAIISVGGEVSAAIDFGSWIKSRNLDVRVRVICYSACANYIFPAGNRKIIENEALVIWHGGMEQKDIRESQSYYASLLAKKNEYAGFDNRKR